MRILGEYGKEDLAKVYVASMRSDDRYIVEFVESLQPPIPRDKKWVLIISSSFGCPMGCRMCDASKEFLGNLASRELLAEIDHMVRRRFPDGRIPIPKFKIQFARMGEPTLNPSVLDVLGELPKTYDAPGLMPCISTIAPIGGERFLNRLIDIKDKLYGGGRFQIQFSIHSTDERKRKELMPARKWNLSRISDYGEKYYKEGDRKITLNFAAARGYPIEPKVVSEVFDADKFFIKLTPMNPTATARNNGLESAVDPFDTSISMVEEFESYGFDVLLSIGELEENAIGSNCGQFVSVFRDSRLAVREDYETVHYKIS